MKKTKLIFCVSSLFFLLFFCLPATSQENWIPGHVVEFDGDTVYGEINYRNWELNPKKIDFKASNDGNVISFTPLGIASFSMNDEVYISAMVETENSLFRVEDLDYNPELVLDTDTVFLKLLVGGPKSLYYYRFSMGIDNFYIQQDDRFILLIYKKYLRMYEGKDYVTENKRYIGQLTAYFQDCPSLKNRLSTVQYKPNSLVNLFKAYYSCINLYPEYIKVQDKVIVEFSILAGMSITTLDFKSEDLVFLANAAFTPSYNFSGGLAMDIVLPFNQKKFSVNNELLYTNYKVESNYEEHFNEEYYIIYDMTVAFTYLKLNNMFRFKYPFRDWFIYIDAGMSNGFAVAGDQYQVVTKKFYGPETTRQEPLMDSYRKYEQGFLAGLGARFKRFSAEARWETGNGMSEYLMLGSATNRYYFLVGFRF